MSIGEKLFKIQQEMNVPKDLYNKYGNFYYRNAETILAEFKKAAKDLKLVLLLNDEIVEIAGKVYIKATASITDYETNEEVLATAYAREADKKTGMDEAQITGAASSYARKYALTYLVFIKHDGGTNNVIYAIMSESVPKLLKITSSGDVFSAKLTNNKITITSTTNYWTYTIIKMS